MGTREKRKRPPILCARGHHHVKEDPHLDRIPEVVDAVVQSLEVEDSPDHLGFPMIPSQEPCCGASPPRWSPRARIGLDTRLRPAAVK